MVEDDLWFYLFDSSECSNSSASYFITGQLLITIRFEYISILAVLLFTKKAKLLLHHISSLNVCSLIYSVLLEHGDKQLETQAFTSPRILCSDKTLINDKNVEKLLLLVVACVSSSSPIVYTIFYFILF